MGLPSRFRLVAARGSEDLTLHFEGDETTTAFTPPRGMAEAGCLSIIKPFFGIMRYC